MRSWVTVTTVYFLCSSIRSTLRHSKRPQKQQQTSGWETFNTETKYNYNEEIISVMSSHAEEMKHIGQHLNFIPPFGNHNSRIGIIYEYGSVNKASSMNLPSAYRAKFYGDPTSRSLLSPFTIAGAHGSY
ncbi:hypothetical protein ASPWEDRAFT_34122 [Aspergillus wentii DTO 134E9]|uniref:Uncharacterized protein n=1 Tax=Aspergillus wentii DTO 134E9 TaxID=1073089 RepID=A0A1L9S0K7_ASPWE|nr:uncharacterized protein ASPWEDRAFT_34122 [Aspergillus wentii DTO 134E9]OJJ40677.1 hypothetical protein ASPWEDRAFT_34122 [Aspergillus wentii DTO 134E9]